MIKFFQKARIKLAVITIILILFFATPKTPDLFILGISLILFGEMIRFWASGYIIKLDKICSDGPYSLTRNPLYIGTFITSAGLCLMSESLYCYIIFCIFFFIVYIPTIIAEEKELEEKFKEDYIQYKKDVPRFIPKLFNRKLPYSGNFDMGIFKRNKEIRASIGWIIITAIMYMKLVNFTL